MDPQTASAPRPYPVSLDTQPPDRFERVQVALRLLAWIALGAIQQSTMGAFGGLYLLLPLIAAILISHRGGAGFLADDSGWLITLLEWVIGVYAYLLFVTDRFPLDTRARPARLQVQPQGVPSTGGALVRLLTTVPHALLLMLLGLVASIVGLIAAILVLLREHYPASLYGFQRDVVAYAARMLAYHASLVDSYPPFSLAAGHEPHAPAGEAGPAGASA